MTSIVQDRYGSAPEDVLRVAEIDRPTMRDDEVLVRVHAVSVDRGTWHIMAGLPYPIRLAGFGLRRPKYANPGRNLAGTVEVIGPGVTGFRPGDEVYGMSTATFAQYATARAGKLARKPANLSFEQAAAVPVSGVTALQAVRDRGRVRAGENVLILGGSGGVGSFAVQLAKADGAGVTAVCSAAKADVVRGLGADRVVGYDSADLAYDDVRYDLILDIGGNTPVSRLRRHLVHNGRLVIVGGETAGRLLGGSGRQVGAQLLSPFVRQKLGTFIASENSADLDVLRELIEAGTVTPVIDRVYPLAGTAAAIRHLLDGRARGKLVISVPLRSAQDPDPGSTP